MKAYEKILALAQQAEDHARKAGMSALDLEVYARTAAYIKAATSDRPSSMVLAALAHAHAAEAYRNAAGAYSELDPSAEVP